MLEISFPEADMARGGVLVQELRSALILEGMPANLLVIAKSDGESMDLGAVLQVVQTVLEPLVPAAQIGQLALAVYQCCRKNRSGLKIKGPGGKTIELKETEVEIERLETLIAELRRDERQQAG